MELISRGGRPPLGPARMDETLAVRMHSRDVTILRALALECGLSLGSYAREVLKAEVRRSKRGNR